MEIGTLRQQAIQMMERMGVIMDSDEESIALGIFPRVGPKLHIFDYA